MEEQIKNTKEWLDERIAALERLLLHSEPELMKNYLQAIAARQAATMALAPRSVNSLEFVDLDGIDAITALLTREAAPLSRDLIVTRLLDGGWGMNSDEWKAKRNARDSIRYHTKQTKRLVDKDGIVGLTAWDEPDHKP